MSTKVNNKAKVAKAIRERIYNATADYSVENLWQLLEIVNTKNLTNQQLVVEQPSVCKIEVEKPIPQRAVVNYVSVDNEVAVGMIYTYLISLEENTPTIHPAFKGRIANPTHANRRLMYSYFFANECKLTNSIPAEVAEAYKANPVKLDKVQREFVTNYLTNNPDFSDKLRSYGKAHYLKAVVA